MANSQLITLVDHFNGRDSKGKYRTITAMEALGLYRIHSLSSRIAELTWKYGYPISKEHKVDPTGKRYVRYGLAR